MFPDLPRVELHLKNGVDVERLKKAEAPKPEEYSQVLTESCVGYLNGEPALLYLQLKEEQVAHIRHAVQRIEYGQTYRTAGLKTQSRVFGYMPRVTVRRDYCTSADLAHRNPEENAFLCSGAKLSSDYFRHFFPTEATRQEALLKERVKPEWIIPQSMFTSGIVNWNNQLRYHLDTGNFPGSWNAMLTFKKDLEGGHLAVPEIDLALEVRDATLSIFNAQALLHGVTPFKKTAPHGYRYTIVYYALQQLCNCGTSAEELERIRLVKTERERKRTST